jgi:hypothetical protein
MNSLTLKENSFTEFTPLKSLIFTSVPYNKNSVLVLVDATLTGKPTSDILYIGRSKKPTKRVFGGYLAGYGGKTTRKIHSMLLNDGFLDKVAVSWMLSEDSKTAQKELLENFKKEHGQYPTWNASKKSTVVKPQQAAKIVKAAPSRKPASAKTTH